MPKLPQVSGAQFVRAPERLGFARLRESASLTGRIRAGPSRVTRPTNAAEPTRARSFTLAVSSIEEQVAHLEKMNIDTSQRTSGEKVKTLMITDPDGNHIAFAEAIDPGLAQ